jgi:tetratricopeptide (TPR) repeat protein
MSHVDAERAEGIRLANQAANLGQDDAEALTWAALAIRELGGNKQNAVMLIDRALLLNPNCAAAWTVSASIREAVGDPDTALAHLERSVRFSPLDPLDWLRSHIAALAHFQASRFGEALPWAEKASHQRDAHGPVWRLKAVLCGLLGRTEEARICVDRLVALDPAATVSAISSLYRASRPHEWVSTYLDGLRKAGLPE